MKRFYTILLLTACALMVNAQSIQKVKVLEYLGEKGKTPLAEVEVSVGNAATVVSDANGECTLKFRTLKPGDKVLVRRISRPGYVVFNTAIIDQWYVTEKDDTELILVMCKQELIMSLREKYHQAVIASLKKEFEGREDSDEYANKLEELEEFIEKFVFLDLNDVCESEKEALNLICAGDINGALKAYETSDFISDLHKNHESLHKLADEAETVKRQKSESEKELDKAYNHVKRHVALLRFQGGKDNIDRSVKLLHDIAYTDTTRFVDLLDYATFCSKMYYYSDAEAALRICLNSPDTIVRIQAGIIQSSINARRRDYGKSIDKLVWACDYMKKKSEERNAPTLYLAERTRAMLGLVSAYNNTRDSVGTFSYREELLTLANRLYDEKKDNETKRLLVEVLYYAYYGNFFFGKNYEEQQTAYKKAIRLQEELYKDDPIGQTAMLAFLHNALADSYSENDKTDSRIPEEIHKSIALYEEIYPKNPKAYAGYLGAAYRSLADLYISKTGEELDKTLQFLQKAEYYINEDQKNNPEALKFRVAGLNYSYAEYYYNKKDWERCDEYAMKSIEEYESLYKKNPAAYATSLKKLHKMLIHCLEMNLVGNDERLKWSKAEYEKLNPEED